MSVTLILFFAVKGQKNYVDRTHCVTMVKQMWEDEQLERMCCLGKIHLAQNGNFIAQDGE